MDIQILEKLDRIEKTITSSHLEKWINIRGVSDYTSLSIPTISASQRSVFRESQVEN